VTQMSNFGTFHNNEKVEITVRGRLQTRTGTLTAAPKRNKHVDVLGEYSEK
jgi:hypothetical protein